MAFSKEILVATTATIIPRSEDTGTIEILNKGPNVIYAVLVDSALATTNARRPIAVNEAWTLDIEESTACYLICPLGLQVTGAATIVTELPRQ